MGFKYFIVSRMGGTPVFTESKEKLDPNLVAGLLQALSCLAQETKSKLVHIKFEDEDGVKRLAYSAKYGNTLFFLKADSFHLKDGILLKMERIYNNIFKDLESTLARGRIIDCNKDKVEIINGLLNEAPLKKKLSEVESKICEICNKSIDSNKGFLAVSIHSYDNTPLFFYGCTQSELEVWLCNWELKKSPAPYEIEFGNKIDGGRLQGVVTNSGIDFSGDGNFLLYYLFGDTVMLGHEMDVVLRGKLNKVIGKL